jgi:rhodanese-related sulfurtransferase
MKRRIFLALLMTVALSGAWASARQQQQVPADRITLEEFKTMLAAGKVFVLDVRYSIDRKIKGATHITLDQLDARMSELPRDREIVTYCS